ncbi:hypothetical protein FHG87_022078 [Trinorchestia longiramus]|nr:hypothetical protein FHG87_022078 [Trinorchestia longiramus]
MYSICRGMFLGTSMGLDVDSNDDEELVEDHRNELTIEELQELHREQQEEVVEERSTEKEKSKGSISTAEIKELCYHLDKTQRGVEKWHPNPAVGNRSINLFNDNVIEHSRKILRNRHKQTTLDKFLKKKPQNCLIAKRLPFQIVTSISLFLLSTFHL